MEIVKKYLLNKQERAFIRQNQFDEINLLTRIINALLFIVRTNYFLIEDKNIIGVATTRLNWIDGVLITKRYRNLGLGSRVISFVLQDLKARHYTRVYLNPRPNKINFWLTMGFVSLNSKVMEKKL